MREALTVAETLVLNALKEELKGEKEGFVRLANLSIKIGRSSNYVSQVLPKLVAKGYLEGTPKGGKLGKLIKIIPETETEVTDETQMELSDISDQFIGQLQDTVNYEVMVVNDPSNFEPTKELKQLQKEIKNKDVEIEMLKRQLKRQLNKNKAKKRKTKLVLKVPQFVQVAKAKIAGGIK